MGTISVSLPSDGETIEVADYNTPINTIVNEINGKLNNANIASDAAIAGSKLADTSINATKLDFSTLLPSLFTAFGSSVQTYTNTGDGGGTGYYINLGGLKLCWGITGSITVSGASSKNISMPSSFFTNVRAAFHDKFGSAVFTTQQGAVPSTTTLQVYFGSGTGSAQVVWFVIGS